MCHAWEEVLDWPMADEREETNASDDVTDESRDAPRSPERSA